MPSVNVYIPEEVYSFLSQRSGGKAATLAKTWIEERYEEEKRK